jgi:tetratricopeptide (TPR) repeat protein
VRPPLTQDSLSSCHPSRLPWIERPGVAEILACALAFLAYVPSLGFQFVYDDKPQIVENPAIHAWRYLPHYFTSHAWAELYPRVSGNYYRPLFLLWFRLNDVLFGLDPKGWHFTTVLCHVAATYLVFRLVCRLAASSGIAFCAATLFALHPVHIESVAWVSGVTDPLMAIFLIGGFLAFLRYREEHRAAWMVVALSLFTLGLLEKETTVVLGPLVFLYECLVAGKDSWTSRFGNAIRQSFWFIVATLLYLPVRACVLHGVSHTVTPLAWTTMALTEPSIIWLYARHLVFPIGLSGLYGLPYIDHGASAGFLLPVAFLAALILGLVWGTRHLEARRLAWFACGWIVLSVAPTLWLRAYAEGDIAHDRYLYVPTIGFVMLVSLFLAEASKYWRTGAKAVQIIGLALIALAYALATARQQIYWASDLLLYTRAYTIAPRDNLICNDLGTALMDVGKSGDAIGLYLQVIAHEPHYWLANYNLGYAYYRIGRLPEAESYLRRAININAADSDEFIYLGLTLWRQGRAGEAAQYVQRAIAIRPTAPGYHFALAMIHRDQSDVPAATAELRLELMNNPESIAAQQQLDSLSKGVAAGSQ